MTGRPAVAPVAAGVVMTAAALTAAYAVATGPRMPIAYPIPTPIVVEIPARVIYVESRPPYDPTLTPAGYRGHDTGPTSPYIGPYRADMITVIPTLTPTPGFSVTTGAAA